MINNKDVNILDIFLTVIVGFLGTILGFFFSDKAMKKLSEEETKSVKEYINLTNEVLEEYKKEKINHVNENQE